MIPSRPTASRPNCSSARQLLIFSPGGMERFFEETLEPVEDRSAPTPDNLDVVIPRFVEAAPRHGLEFGGTHTTKLDLRLPGVPAVFATGKRITLPREKVDVAVEQGKVVVLNVERLPDGGLMDILTQMGVALPRT
jgi:hypothetical protein